jgi:hypothetical protein
MCTFTEAGVATRHDVANALIYENAVVAANAGHGKLKLISYTFFFKI